MNLSIYELLPIRSIRQFTRFEGGTSNADMSHYKNYLFTERRFREFGLSLSTRIDRLNHYTKQIVDMP